MIDLTPLDVRNKRGDFRKLLRGYDPQEVDIFLELVAERMEALVRETIQLRERAETLGTQVTSQSERERAVQEALVTAQELREDIRTQAHRESELILQEAESAARRMQAEAEAQARAALRDAELRLEQARGALDEVERRRNRFLRTYRQLLERELDMVEVEEGRGPLEESTVELDLGGTRFSRAEEEGLMSFDEAGELDPGGEVRWEEAGALDFDPVRVNESAEAEVPPEAMVDRLDEIFRQAQAEGDPGDATEGVSGRDEGQSRLFPLPDLPPPDADGGMDPDRG
jgi:DivIVA domain-containing protein